MSHGLSNCLGAIAAWLCLAPVVFAREPLSIPGYLASGFSPAHHIANLSFLLIWAAGGIFLVVGGLLAFASPRFRAPKSNPLSGPAQVDRRSEIALVWTLIPLFVLVLFLA